MEENEPQKRMGAPGKLVSFVGLTIKHDDSNRITIPKLDELEKRVEALESRNERVAQAFRAALSGAYNPHFSDLDAMLNGSAGD